MREKIEIKEKGRSLLLYEVISKDEIEKLGLELICTSGKEYLFQGESGKYKKNPINNDYYHLVGIYELSHNKNETKILANN